MPELPDVEGFRRVLADNAVGRTIRTVEVRDNGVLRGATTGQLREQLVGHRFRTPRRHGKWLLAPVGGAGVMLVHFGMTGSLRWSPSGAADIPHTRVEFGLRDGTLRYVDQRKLKGIHLVADDAAVAEELGELGPDASAVTRRDLVHRLSTRRGGINAALTDQQVVAGLGNLLADEIL